MKYKKILFNLFAMPFLLLHSYFLIPKIYIIYRIFGSRMSAYSDGIPVLNEIIWAIIIIFLSYLVIVLLIYSIFNNIFNNLKRRLTTIFSLAFILISGINFGIFYESMAWFENTFTTEMNFMWGPFDSNDIKRGERVYFGPLTIERFNKDQSTRFEEIFSEIDKDDWILTTISLGLNLRHWESNPVFLYFDEHQTTRLENMNKEALTFLFNRKILKNRTSEIFNAKEPVYQEFWSYINQDSTSTDSPRLKRVYSMIDSIRNL